MQILAISGSVRAASTNARVLEAAARLASASVDVVLYDGLETLPYFNPDVEARGLPPPVARWRAQVGAADALLISSPEYAHGVPGALKNALDWLVGGPELYQKPVGLLNPSPRSTHAHAALVEILTTMAARVSPEASAVVPLSGRPLDAAAIVGDPELSLAIRSALDALVRAASTPARGL